VEGERFYKGARGLKFFLVNDIALPGYQSAVCREMCSQRNTEGKKNWTGQKKVRRGCRQRSRAASLNKTCGQKISLARFSWLVHLHTGVHSD
jgi:hypothetical protein